MNDQESMHTENFPQVQLTQNNLPDITNVFRSIKEADLDDRPVRITITATIDIMPRE